MHDLLVGFIGTPYGWWMYGCGCVVGYWFHKINVRAEEMPAKESEPPCAHDYAQNKEAQ